MSKFHSTVSRRTFMKGLGLGAAGLGVAAAAAPVLHDLDEAISSPGATWKRPWWVKEVDKPSMEIDWQTLKRYDSQETVFAGGFVKALGQAEVDRLEKQKSERILEWMSVPKPGWSLRDWGLYRSLGYEGVKASFVGNQSRPTYKKYGVARYEGTPEENAQMMRAVLKFRGAAIVGFAELNERTKSLIFTRERDGTAYAFEDVDEGYEVKREKRVIPNKAKWVISYAVPMSEELIRRMPTALAEGAVQIGYSYGRIVGSGVQEFLHTLGYQALGAGDNSVGPNPGWAVMAGLSEMSRAHQNSISPELGTSNRMFKLITDMPLAPSGQVDFGVFRYCKTCKKCATECPSGALSMDTEPTWDTPGPWSNPGQKAFPYDAVECYRYWKEITTGCGICMARCVFAHKNNALIHQVVAPTVSMVPIFNGFLKNMDDVFGYGFEVDQESWWEQDIPIYATYSEGKIY